MLNEEETIEADILDNDTFEVDILDNDTLSVDIETGGGSGSSTWGSITGNILSQTDLMSKFAEKQDNLVSGTNIKTINNQSILGSGNISIGGGGGSTYTAGDNIQISEDNVISATDTIYDDTEIKGDISDLEANKADKSEIPDVSNFITKDVDNLTYYTLKTDTGSTIELTINSSTYVMTLNLKNSAGTTISTGNIDLPLETMVVGGSYDSQTKKVILTLKNGQTVEFSIADLVSGLQSEITSNNKLSSDLVDDTNKTNKFVTSSEKTAWNSKADAENTHSNSTKNTYSCNYIEKIFGLDQDTYNSSSTYSVGDIVIHDGAIYECTTAITTAEAWNSAHWTIVPIFV